MPVSGGGAGGAPHTLGVACAALTARHLAWATRASAELRRRVQRVAREGADAGAALAVAGAGVVSLEAHGAALRARLSTALALSRNLGQRCDLLDQLAQAQGGGDGWDGGGWEGGVGGGGGAGEARARSRLAATLRAWAAELPALEGRAEQVGQRHAAVEARRRARARGGGAAAAAAAADTPDTRRLREALAATSAALQDGMAGCRALQRALELQEGGA